MFDAHIHLQDSRLDGCREALIRRAVAAGVTGACCCGTSPADWDRMVATMGPYPEFRIMPAFGVHPWFVVDLAPDWLAQLRRFLSAYPDAPVGEIGLDGLHPELPRDVQRRIFDAQIALAVELRRPVILHGARAWGELIEALQPFARALPGFMAHAFSGSSDVLKSLVALGGSVSFAGSVCHPQARRVRAAAGSAPADRLLAETDTPDIFPHGGTPVAPETPRLNHPANLARVVASLAELQGRSTSDMDALTTANARRFFRVC